jgi:hypothetical protein
MHDSVHVVPPANHATLWSGHVLEAVVGGEGGGNVRPLHLEMVCMCVILTMNGTIRKKISS